MSATVQIAELGNYLDAFTALQQRGARHPEWLRRLRENAFAQFCDAGFPTTRDEDWRFTNVSAIAKQSFAPAAGDAAGISTADLDQYAVPGAHRLVFVNGHFAPQLSDVQNLPAGVRLGSLADAIAQDPASIEGHLGRYADTGRDAFCSLNTAFIEDGGYVAIAAETIVERPIHFLFVSTATADPWMVYPRNLLIVEKSSQVGIVEEHLSLGDGVVFTDSITELIAGDNSTVSHHAIERENRESFHISTLRIQQGRSATVRSHSVLIGGALVRNNVHPVLGGEGGECLINGLYLGNGTQHLDNYMLVEHASPHCASHQFYNGILNDRAHGVFHGRILVHKDAQKTDAKQTNRNLLLSDDAQIDTKPQLEIYADDVKCTHGATIGQIDENALFYLRSRGLNESSAREMLLLAFAGECLTRIQPGAVREYLEQAVDRSLLGTSRYTKEIG